MAALGPGHNGGQPLLGNPIAAVLYPGKVVYAVLPYAWGARLYVIVHQVLAVLGGVALRASFGVSWTGAFLGGLSFGFGGPVLHQYCNVNSLVGAAWLPWGLCAIDRMLRLHRPRAPAELALVLAMQILGGDPEMAYLTAVAGAGYAVILSNLRHASFRPGISPARRAWRPVPLDRGHPASCPRWPVCREGSMGPRGGTRSLAVGGAGPGLVVETASGNCLPGTAAGEARGRLAR